MPGGAHRPFGLKTASPLETPKGDRICSLPSDGAAAQWNESPHAQLPWALGLSIVKPCFWMVSSKSMVDPSR